MDISETAVYDLKVWIGSEVSNGAFHLSMDGEAITEVQTVTKTTGWTDYQAHVISGVYLESGNHILTFHIDNSNAFNILSMDFELSPGSPTIPFELLYGTTKKTENSIELTANYIFKDETYSGFVNDFEVLRNGSEVGLNSISYSSTLYPRTIVLELTEDLLYTDNIIVNYTGNGIQSANAVILESKSDLSIQNELATRLIVPGKLQAEDFYQMEGIDLTIEIIFIYQDILVEMFLESPIVLTIPMAIH